MALPLHSTGSPLSTCSTDHTVKINVCYLFISPTDSKLSESKDGDLGTRQIVALKSPLRTVFLYCQILMKKMSTREGLTVGHFLSEE